MPLRPCRELGCPNDVVRGRCLEHTIAERQRRRDSVARRVYVDPRWVAARERAIAREGGQCQWSDGPANRPRRCTSKHRLHGHHAYPGGVEQMILNGISPFEERFIVVLCGTHHAEMEAWLRQQARNPSKRR